MLTDLHLAGVSLTPNADGTGLLAAPRANLTPALSAAITVNKPALLELLAQSAETQAEQTLWGLGRKAQAGSSEAMAAYLAELKRYELVCAAGAREDTP